MKNKIYKIAFSVLPALYVLLLLGAAKVIPLYMTKTGECTQQVNFSNPANAYSGDGSALTGIAGGAEQAIYFYTIDVTLNEALKGCLISNYGSTTPHNYTMVGGLSAGWNCTILNQAGSSGGDYALLLHLDGADTSTTITDTSLVVKAMTAVGDAQLDDAQKVFGATSLRLDGTGDWVTSPDNAAWDLGTIWSIAFRVRFETSAPSYCVFASHGRGCFNVDVDGWSLMKYEGNLRFSYKTGGTVVPINNAWTPSADTWYAVLVNCDGTNLYAYVDGTQIGTTQAFSSNLSVSSELLVIGASSPLDSYAYPLDGWMDELLIVKGRCLQTGASYVVETAAYADPIDAAITIVPPAGGTLPGTTAANYMLKSSTANHLIKLKVVAEQYACEGIYPALSSWVDTAPTP